MLGNKFVMKWLTSGEYLEMNSWWNGWHLANAWKQIRDEVTDIWRMLGNEFVMKWLTSGECLEMNTWWRDWHLANAWKWIRDEVTDIWRMLGNEFVMKWLTSGECLEMNTWWRDWHLANAWKWIRDEVTDIWRMLGNEFVMKWLTSSECLETNSWWSDWHLANAWKWIRDEMADIWRMLGNNFAMHQENHPRILRNIRSVQTTNEPTCNAPSSDCQHVHVLWRQTVFHPEPLGDLQFRRASMASLLILCLFLGLRGLIFWGWGIHPNIMDEALTPENPLKLPHTRICCTSAGRQFRISMSCQHCHTHDCHTHSVRHRSPPCQILWHYYNMAVDWWCWLNFRLLRSMVEHRKCVEPGACDTDGWRSPPRLHRPQHSRPFETGLWNHTKNIFK